MSSCIHGDVTDMRCGKKVDVADKRYGIQVDVAGMCGKQVNVAVA